MRRVLGFVLPFLIELFASANGLQAQGKSVKNVGGVVVGSVAAQSWGVNAEYPIVLTNAYGDTAFVDSIRVWRQTRSVMVHVEGTSRDTVARDADGHPVSSETLCDSWTMRGTTRGTMAAVFSLPTVSRSASEVLDDVVAWWPDIIGRRPNETRPSVVVEFGSYPAPPGSPRVMGVGPLCYDTRFPVIRVTFFVFGRPDSTALKDEPRGAGQEEWARDWRPGEPTPIRTLDQARPYDVTAREVAATARVVGEVLVDFVDRTVRPR